MLRTNLSPSYVPLGRKCPAVCVQRGGEIWPFVDMMAQSCTHKAQKEDKLNDEGANTPPPSAQICGLVTFVKHCTVHTYHIPSFWLHESLFWDVLGRIWEPTSTEVHRPKCKEEEPHLRSAWELSPLHRSFSGNKRDALWSHTAGTLWCVMSHYVG